MERRHLQLARQVSREAPRRWKALRATLLCAVLAAVLAGGATEPGASVVIRMRGFLEFYSGVFTLVGLSAAVVVGLAASARFTPAGLRVLAQSAHRATAVMSVSFLGVHVFLKVLERHATILDAVVPFAGGHERAVWIGLGTIAGDAMVLILATGVARGRYIGRGRPWTWRVLHISAYLCWPIAVAHGLLAGRTPKDWVTLSYAICVGVVAITGLVRFALWLRQPRAVRRLGGRVTGRSVARAPEAAENGIPDEEFWTEFKREAQLWSGSTK